MANDTKVITGEVRLSYVRVLSSKKNDQDKDVWSVLLLIPKKDKATLAKLKAAAEIALETGIANNKLAKGATLKNSWTTMKDGDERDDLDEAPEYIGNFYMNVNAYRRPGVVDRHRNPIVDEADIKSGDYGRVSISAYPFNVGKNKGVTFGLENVQKLRDGDSLGGAAASPDDDFDDLPDEDGDDLI